MRDLGGSGGGLLALAVCLVAGAREVSALAAAQKPHVIHIVMDDVGHNDLGFANSDIRSPHLDELVSSGVLLDRLYTFKECAPTRGSVMTGRLPFHFGYYRNPDDDGAVSTNFTLLPQLLQGAGYRTHAIGKWHLGFRNKAHTPTMRGFETFLGYWHWGEDYFTHVYPPAYKGPAKCRGIDFNNCSGARVASVGHGADGKYSANVFVDEFRRVVRNHPKEQPLYVYLAFQNAHDPYQVPLPYVDPSIHNGPRRNFSGMVTALDEAVSNVTTALKVAGMWDNSILVVHTDNGGELPYDDGTGGGAGSNTPLRGGKFSLWEGGVRGRAWVSGPLVPESRRNTTWSGLMHVSDLLPTICEATGTAVPADTGPFPLDGYAQWANIVEGRPSPRKVIVHQPLNEYWNGSCTQRDVADKFQPSCGGGILDWPFKLLTGFPGDGRHLPSPSMDGTSRPGAGARSADCVASPCLFNIELDPNEEENLAAQEPAIVQRLLTLLRSLSRDGPPRVAGSDGDGPSDAECAVVESTGTWMPWE